MDVLAWTSVFSSVECDDCNIYRTETSGSGNEKPLAKLFIPVINICIYVVQMCYLITFSKEFICFLALQDALKESPSKHSSPNGDGDGKKEGRDEESRKEGKGRRKGGRGRGGRRGSNNRENLVL